MDTNLLKEAERMATQKNATYKVDNRNDFDEINFKTIASQVKMENGTNLESGFFNSKADTGYTKLPNGLILQWGISIININNNSGAELDANFPVAFPNKVLNLQCTVTWNNINWQYAEFNCAVANKDDSLSKLRVVAKTCNGNSVTGAVVVLWTALGY